MTPVEQPTGSVAAMTAQVSGPAVLRASTASFGACDEHAEEVQQVTSSRIVVTGAGGFIGGHVVEALRGQGRLVVGVGRSAGEGVDVVLDLSDVAAIRGLLDQEQIDSVVHCAWSGHPRSSAHEFTGQLHANVVTSANVGLACGLAGVEQLVFVSSGGATHRGSRERPPPAYGWAKMAAEGVLVATADSFGTILTILRPTAVFGPGQDPAGRLGVVAVFADKLLKGLPLEVFGSLEQSRDFLHVRDLADVVVSCLAERVSGVFPVGGPHQVTIGSLIRTLEGAAGVSAEVQLVEVSGVDPVVVQLDNSALLAAVGWTPKRDLPGSVDEILEELIRLRRNANPGDPTSSTGSDALASP